MKQLMKIDPSKVVAVSQRTLGKAVVAIMKAGHKYQHNGLTTDEALRALSEGMGNLPATPITISNCTLTNKER